jgi:hypothetical protein
MMNAGLADGTTTGDLVLQQAKIVPQTQHFFDFSHGQSLLGHSVSPLARGEIPIGCPAPLSAPTQKARSRNVNINSGSNPPLSSRFGLFTSPESVFTCPESLFTSSRNLYSHRPGIGIHMPRNTQASRRSGGSRTSASAIAGNPRRVGCAGRLEKAVSTCILLSIPLRCDD